MPKTDDATSQAQQSGAVALQARFNQGLALHKQGKLADAELIYGEVLQQQPNHFDALHYLGVIAIQTRRLERGVELIGKAIGLNGGLAAAHSNLGYALLDLNRAEEALASYDRAIVLQPDNAETHHNRGNALRELKRSEEALASYDRSIALKPDHAEAYCNRGAALQELKRHEEALASYDRAIALKPDYAMAYSNRGNALMKLGRPEEALANCERAIALRADYTQAHYNRGVVLEKLKRPDEALASYDQAITLKPDYAEAHCNRGIALMDLNRAEEALASYSRALALQPDFAEAQWNLSTGYLCLGRFAEGWPLYESRWAPGIFTTPARPYPQPRWDGKPLPGTLLVWGDQGLGDQVIYAGVIDELQRQARQVVVEIDPRLVDLYARSFPGVKVIGAESALYGGPVDMQEPLSGLPRHLRPSFESFPQRAQGYLVPDAARVRQLRARLAADGRPVIGLTWISRNPKIGRLKSAQLKDFAALLKQPGYRFVDLQYGDTSAERATVERELGVRVERLDDIDNTNDIDGLAALIAACDAVLSVSSTTAHLAGAVGARTWVMVPIGRGHLWYWFMDRPASPWYPRVEVRRQAEGQAWSDLAAALTPEIDAALRQ